MLSTGTFSRPNTRRATVWSRGASTALGELPIGRNDSPSDGFRPRYWRDAPRSSEMVALWGSASLHPQCPLVRDLSRQCHRLGVPTVQTVRRVNPHYVALSIHCNEAFVHPPTVSPSLSKSRKNQWSIGKTTRDNPNYGTSFDHLVSSKAATFSTTVSEHPECWTLVPSTDKSPSLEAKGVHVWSDVWMVGFFVFRVDRLSEKFWMPKQFLVDHVCNRKSIVFPMWFSGCLSLRCDNSWVWELWV